MLWLHTEDAIVAHIDNVEPSLFPCDAMGMAEFNPRITLPFSQDCRDFVGSRIESPDRCVFIISKINVVGIIEAQMFG